MCLKERILLERYYRTQTAKAICIYIQGMFHNLRIRKEVKYTLDASDQYIKFDEVLVEMTPLMKSIEKCLMKLIVSQLKYFHDRVTKYLNKVE